MNKFLRVLGLGLMVMTFAFVGIAQGQERTQEVVYKDFTDNFESTETARMQKAWMRQKNLSPNSTLLTMKLKLHI